MLTASRIFIIICAFLSVAIVLEYALFSPAWKKTFPGKVLMTIFTLFAATLTTSALTIVVGITPWIEALRLATYLGLTIALLLIAVLIVAIQEAAYQDEKEYQRLAEVARLREENNGQVDQQSEGS